MTASTPTDTMDPAQIGRADRALEPLHSMIYFAPEAEREYVDAGLRPGRMGYFASRAAPMGPVSAEVVAATFYNFNPELVARHIPRAWTLASPERILAARVAGADQALRRLLGPDVIEGAELAELAELARAATAGCRLEGRPLYAGHAGLDWPDPPHLVLWHAATLLREHRGDGHIAALVRAGLTGLQALITHTATGRGFVPTAAKVMRHWSEDKWQEAVQGLADRGLLAADGTLSAAGQALRADLEAQTDAMAAGPWARLGPDGVARVIELARPLARQVVAAGAFPPDTFAKL